ncbi:LOW QUALITY PROTEIN: hypothetical protein HID58_056591, partial [Brassica napus]
MSQSDEQVTKAFLAFPWFMRDYVILNSDYSSAFPASIHDLKLRERLLIGLCLLHLQLNHSLAALYLHVKLSHSLNWIGPWASLCFGFHCLLAEKVSCKVLQQSLVRIPLPYLIRPRRKLPVYDSYSLYDDYIGYLSNKVGLKSDEGDDETSSLEKGNESNAMLCGT